MDEEIRPADIARVWVNKALEGLMDKIVVRIDETSNHGKNPSFVLAIYKRTEDGLLDENTLLAGKLFGPEIELFDINAADPVGTTMLGDPHGPEKLRAHIERNL